MRIVLEIIVVPDENPVSGVLDHDEVAADLQLHVADFAKHVDCRETDIVGAFRITQVREIQS